MFQRHVTPRECFAASLRLHDADGTESGASDPANRDEFLKVRQGVTF